MSVTGLCGEFCVCVVGLVELDSARKGASVWAMLLTTVTSLDIQPRGASETFSTRKKCPKWLVANCIS
jgi:hypothetical protein